MPVCGIFSLPFALPLSSVIVLQKVKVRNKVLVLETSPGPKKLENEAQRFPWHKEITRSSQASLLGTLTGAALM